MTCRLLACDIDDTLVRFPNPPSPRVQRAIRAARDAGVTVVLISGRAFPRARPLAELLELDTPIVCNHGGSIRDATSGQTLLRRTMPRELVTEIVSWLQRWTVHMFLFDNDHIYRDGTADEIVPDFHIYTEDARSTFARDLRPLVPEHTEIVLCTSPDSEYLGRIFAAARKRFKGVRVLFTHPFGVDILPQEATKSRALTWLTQYLNIPREEVVAVGNGENDIDMLSWAGLGVAMGDGTPGAKAAADVVAPPFDRDGLAWAIERYILKQKPG